MVHILEHVLLLLLLPKDGLGDGCVLFKVGGDIGELPGDAVHTSLQMFHLLRRNARLPHHMNHTTLLLLPLLLLPLLLLPVLLPPLLLPPLLRDRGSDAVVAGVGGVGGVVPSWLHVSLYE